MDLTNTRLPRKAAQSRGFSASLRRLAARRTASVLTAGALMLSVGIAHAASQTYTGPGLFSTGFGGTAVSNNTFVFGGATPTTVNNDLTGLIIGGGTSAGGTNPYYNNGAGPGSYLNDAIDFTGASAYTLNGNDVLLQGNIVNSSSALQTINFNLTQTSGAGLNTGVYGYVIDTGAAGITLGGSYGTAANLHDLIKIGSGALNFNNAVNEIGALLLYQGTMNVNGTVHVHYFMGQNSPGPGAVTSTINVGTGGSFTNDGYIGVLTGNTQNFNITGSGQFHIGGDLNVSDQVGTFGTLALSGTGVVTAGNLYVGKNASASGVMTVSGGSVTAANGGGAIQIGTGSSTGTMTQTGGSVTSTLGEVWVGNGSGSTATYNISAGSLTSGSWLAVGRSAGSTGTLNISGTANVTKAGDGTSNLTVAGNGGIETGTINQTGGTLTNTVSQTWIGENGNGAYNLSGGTASLGVLDIDHAGSAASSSGVVSLSGTGVLSTTQVVKSGTQGTATLNLNGGTLQANTGAVATGSGTFLGGLDAANVQSGGAVINTNGNSVTVTQNLLHSGAGADGGLTKNGAGTLTLSGADTYNGKTTVNAGQLSLTTIASLGSGNLLLPNSTTPWVNLLFTGTETINALSFNLGSSFVTPGTYGSLTSTAANKFAAFSGTGVLNVAAAPEPSQYAAFGLGLLGLAGLALKARRRSAV